MSGIAAPKQGETSGSFCEQLLAVCLLAWGKRAAERASSLCRKGELEALWGQWPAAHVMGIILLSRDSHKVFHPHLKNIQ